MENRPNRIIWHHTADTSVGAQSRKVNDYHRTRQFPVSKLGYYGGYHYLIEKDGTTFRFRYDEEIGAHDAGENIGSIGIALAGNFDVELPTPAQELTLADLLAALVARYGIALSRIEPHRFGDKTSCPGKLLDDWWARDLYVRQRLNFFQRTLLAISEKLAQLLHAPR